MDDDKGIIPNEGHRFFADAGIRLSNFRMGVFFRSIGFEDPDAKMVQASVMLGYTFR